MKLYNTGTISFSEQIAEEEKSVIENIFSGDVVRFEENEVSFDEVPGDIMECLEEIVKEGTKSGNEVKEISVDYYGDFDGGYRLINGKIKCFSPQELGLIDATSEELLIKAAEKPEGATIYRVYASGHKVNLIVCIATTIKDAKRLTKKWVSQFAAGEEEDEVYKSYLFHLVEERLNKTGLDCKCVKETTLNVLDWLGLPEQKSKAS